MHCYELTPTVYYSAYAVSLHDIDNFINLLVFSKPVLNINSYMSLIILADTTVASVVLINII